MSYYTNLKPYELFLDSFNVRHTIVKLNGQLGLYTPQGAKKYQNAPRTDNRGDVWSQFEHTPVYDGNCISLLIINEIE